MRPSSAYPASKENGDSPHPPIMIEAIINAGTGAGEVQTPVPPPVAHDVAATRLPVSLDAEQAPPPPDTAAAPGWSGLAAYH
jgi:hypothetical protein